MVKLSWLAGASAFALATTVAVSSAHAQANGAPKSEAAVVDEIVVTGSFIGGNREDAAVPVDVISAEDLRRQGQPTTVNLIKSLPAAQSSIGESNRFLGSEAGVATVNLRGFGSQRTLVLFNGRRMAAAPAAIAIEAVDLNLIPQAAIGRLELLKEGAAATYGSDAIGGVVNFITRRDLDGFEVNGNYTFTRGSNGDYDVSLSYGQQFDRGNALVAATYRRRSELRTTDRDWALLPWATNPFGGWSTATNPGVFQTGTAAQLAAGAFSQSFLDNGCTEVGGVLINSAVPSAGCRLQFSQHDNLVNDEYHYQVYGEINFDLTEDLEFHGEVLWSSHDVPQQRVSGGQSTIQFPTPIGASGGSVGGGVSPYPAIGLNQQSRYYVPTTNPGLVAFLANPVNCPALGAICTNAAANGVITSQTLWRPFGYGGMPLWDDQGGADFQRRYGDSLRIAGELKGKTFGDTNWTFALTGQQNTGIAETPDMSVTRFQLALLGLGGPNCNPATGTPGVGPCMYINPFANGFASNTALGLNNPFYVAAGDNRKPELLNWLRQNYVTRTVTQLFTADLVFSGSTGLNLWAADDVAWAAGFQYRYDRVKVDPETINDVEATPCVDSPPFGDGLPFCRNGVGPGLILAAVRPYDIDRVVKALFAEVRLPITDTFEVTGAIRYEDYGGNVGSTTNPKIAARWQALDWLTLRGSLGSTFRSPPQSSITPGFNRANANFNLPGVGTLYRPVDIYANPQLRPETADTLNAGLVFKLGNFSGSLDYYKFKLKNELTSEVAATLISALFPSASPATWTRCADPTFRSRFTFADDGNPATDDCAPANLLGVRTNLINGPDVETSGVDFQASYDWRDAFLGGDVAIGADGTYTIEYKRGAVVTAEGIVIQAATDRAGTSELLAAFYSYPQLRANVYLNWNREGHNLRWTTRYKEGTTNKISGLADVEQDDEIIHDLVYTGQFAWDTTLTVGVYNVLDTDPPFTRSIYNYDYTNAWFLGRTVQVGLRKRF